MSGILNLNEMESFAMEITLPRKVLAAMLLLAAKNDIRYYINGLFVEISPDDVRIVATNGQILGAYRIEEKTGVDEPISLIIPREVLAQIRSKKTVPGVVLRLHDDDTCSLVDIDMSFGFTPIDGRFPDYRRVIPEKVSGKPGHYNPEYPALFLAVAKALGTSRPSIDLVQNGEDQAALIYIPSAREQFVGAIMPLRIDPAPPLTAPSWVKQRYAAKQETEPKKSPAKRARTGR